ncbi:hypothetical protein SK128_000368 [Halocaridina rubra]|uniref:C2H2-type domain-containing protein n=1 Tax=Halocaridina rubra TaxID=373956 RepID=A0AAN8X701_HALRR
MNLIVGVVLAFYKMTDSCAVQYLCCICNEWFESRICLLRHNCEHYADHTNLYQKLRRKYLMYHRYRLQWKTSHAYSFRKKLHSCLICGKTFISQRSVEIHKVICVKTETYPCIFCNMSFQDYSNLMKHLHLHTDERPYICSDCGSSFVSLTLLQKHEELHNVGFRCAKCGEIYEDLESLNHHTQNHLRSFTCDICEKVFDFHSHLRRHLIIKTPHPSCSKCNLKFKYKCELMLHKQMHSRVKEEKKEELKQMIFKYAFIVKGNHPYVCKFCLMPFAAVRKGYLIRHLKEAHDISSAKFYPSPTQVSRCIRKSRKGAKRGKVVTKSRSHRSTNQCEPFNKVKVSPNDNIENSVASGCKYRGCPESINSLDMNIAAQEGDNVYVSSNGKIASDQCVLGGTNTTEQVLNGNIISPKKEYANTLLRENPKYYTACEEDSFSVFSSSVQDLTVDLQMLKHAENKEKTDSGHIDKYILELEKPAQSYVDTAYEKICSSQKLKKDDLLLSNLNKCRQKVLPTSKTRKKNPWLTGRRWLHSKKSRKCHVCGKIYKSKSYHIKMCHSSNTNTAVSNPQGHAKAASQKSQEKSQLYCFKCNRCFGDELDFEMHTFTHMNDVTGSQIAERSKNVFSMLQHDLSKPYYCKKCNISFEREGTFRSHEKLHMTVKVHITRITTSTQINIERDESKKSCSVTCRLCNRHFRTKKGYKSHMAVCEKHCRDCGRIYSRISSLNRHRRKAHEVLQNQGTKIITKKSSGIKIHYHHKEINSYKQNSNTCKITKVKKAHTSYIAAKSQSKAEKKKVVKISSGINTYYHHTEINRNTQNSKTDKTAKVKEAQTSHIAAKSKPKADKQKLVKKCPACRRKFDDFNLFANHIVKHEKSNWHICPYCAICFWNREGLSEHMRSHHKQSNIIK